MIAFQLQHLRYAKGNEIDTVKHKPGTVVVSVACPPPPKKNMLNNNLCTYHDFLFVSAISTN
jgi:hypothetical protein